MLLNELCHSPQSVLEAVVRLLEGALALDTGTVTDGQNPTFNSGVHIILYALRLGARVDNYLTFLIEYVECSPCCLVFRVCAVCVSGTDD